VFAKKFKKRIDKLGKTQISSLLGLHRLTEQDCINLQEGKVSSSNMSWNSPTLASSDAWPLEGCMDRSYSKIDQQFISEASFNFASTKGAWGKEIRKDNSRKYHDKPFTFSLIRADAQEAVVNMGVSNNRKHVSFVDNKVRLMKSSGTPLLQFGDTFITFGDGSLYEKERLEPTKVRLTDLLSTIARTDTIEITVLRRVEFISAFEDNDEEIRQKCCIFCKTMRVVPMTEPLEDEGEGGEKFNCRKLGIFCEDFAHGLANLKDLAAGGRVRSMMRLVRSVEEEARIVPSSSAKRKRLSVEEEEARVNKHVQSELASLVEHAVRPDANGNTILHLLCLLRYSSWWGRKLQNLIQVIFNNYPKSREKRLTLTSATNFDGRRAVDIACALGNFTPLLVLAIYSADLTNCTSNCKVCTFIINEYAESNKKKNDAKSGSGSGRTAGSKKRTGNPKSSQQPPASRPPPPPPSSRMSSFSQPTLRAFTNSSGTACFSNALLLALFRCQVFKEKIELNHLDHICSKKNCSQNFCLVCSLQRLAYHVYSDDSSFINEDECDAMNPFVENILVTSQGELLFKVRTLHSV
jgi:hypothetical protein